MEGLIIDTNSTSPGNFEREMCAFITGKIGTCGKGRREAEEYLEEYEELDNVRKVEDPYLENVYRPVRIYPTANLWNNGLGFHFKDGEENLALEKYRKFVKKENERHIEVVEGHRGKNLPSWTEEVIDKEIERYKRKIKEAFEKTEVEKNKAYQSIVIYLRNASDKKEIEFMKERAYKYAKRIGIEITGFRILKESTKNV